MTSGAHIHHSLQWHRHDCGLSAPLSLEERVKETARASLVSAHLGNLVVRP